MRLESRCLQGVQNGRAEMKEAEEVYCIKALKSLQLGGFYCVPSMALI